MAAHSTMPIRTRVTSPLLLSLVVLSACGGGGVGAPATPPVSTIPPGATFNAQAAMTAWLTGTGRWTVRGRGSDGNDYALTFEVRPGAPAVYPLDPFRSVGRNSVQTADLSVNGVSLGSTTTTIHFPDFTILLTGIYHGADASCSSAFAGRSAQTAAPVGASSWFASLTDLDSCIGTTNHVSNTEIGWSIEAEGATAYFCITEDVTELASGIMTRSATCIETDVAGRLGTRAKVRLNTPGLTLEMRS